MSTPDSVQLLAEFGSRLDAVHSQSDLRLALQIEIVDLADRGAREFLEELEARYFAGGGNAESEGQSRVWGPVSLYCAQLEAAYMHLVRQFQTYSQGWAEVGDKIPMVVARALRATSMRLKWQLMRYLPVEKDLWQTLSQLWTFAEDKGMEQARVVVYEDKSTLPREFLKPMMLAVSAADSLPALEVDIAHRVIDHLSDRFELQRHPAKTCNFFVDIDRWTAPERYTPVSVVRSGARFFGPGRVMTQIDELVSRLAGGEIAPREMNLHGISDMGAVVHVLEHLGRHWWERRPERRAERRRSLSQIGVLHGFDAIMTRLSSDEIVEQMRPPAETWSVENESDDGYGAVLPMGHGGWLHVGKVLALKPADTRIWAVGIVRRLAAQEGGQRHIGIELLARGARLVTLHRRTDAQQTWKALLLPSHSGGDASLGEVSLLLPAGSFLPDSNLEMEVYSTSYILEPRLLLEHENDFEMARYRILQRVG
ncbi:MAG: hypothetical protein HY067_05120 [Betaproteobacteria bacterium]|nr:hypothetical protein [Betaproteobacteria bacterium]